MGARRAANVLITLVLLVRGGAFIPMVRAQSTTPINSAEAAELTALYAGPGVVFRAPENCINDQMDPYDDPATLAFCAVKDVVGALGGPSSGAAVMDFVEAPNRFEFNQPLDCDTIGAVADGKHDNCAVVTGAASLLREGLPVRFFGVCAKAVPKDCAVLGTISDPNWKPDGVYLLMDPAKVTVHCQYAQDADRNGCNEGGTYTTGQQRPLCTEDATNPECQYGADETEAMLDAYTAYCTDDAENCLENQLEAQWNVDSVIAIGYMNRGDQAWDCEDSQTKAEHFAEAVNTTWSTDVPIVQLFIDVANNQLRFGDAATGCQPPQDHASPGRGRTTCGLASGTGSAALPRRSPTATHRSLPAMPTEHPRASAESPFPETVTPTRTSDEVLAIAGPLWRWRDSRCSALAAMRALRASRARDARRL